MNDLVVIALVGAGGAVIGSIITSLVAPWVKFAIQKKDARARRGARANAAAP